LKKTAKVMEKLFSDIRNKKKAKQIKGNFPAQYLKWSVNKPKNEQSKTTQNSPRVTDLPTAYNSLE